MPAAVAAPSFWQAKIYRFTAYTAMRLASQWSGLRLLSGFRILAVLLLVFARNCFPYTYVCVDTSTHTLSGGI